MLAGATMHAPAALPRWVEELPRDRPIVVYCICGFQVSGTAVAELRRRATTPGRLSAGLALGAQLAAQTQPMDLSTYEKVT